MHVALYFHGRLPVTGYGGTQRVVVWLARGLAQMGHRVTVLAPNGSRIPEATLVAVDPRQIRSGKADIAQLVPRSADILHTHTPLVKPPSAPYVFSLHGNRRDGSATPNTIYLSADHARRHGSSAFVYNGVDPADYVVRTEKAGYDLFLGRLHSSKGYRWAIKGARRAGKRLVVAGGWRPSLRRSLRFAGSVHGQRKAELLAGAECLWMPALWDEPFGLTLIEALMSGTPVLGTRRGALPEIVSHDVGHLGDTLEELVELRKSVDQCDASACRSRAERWFTHTRMAQEYLRMYDFYLNKGCLPPGRVID